MSYRLDDQSIREAWSDAARAAAAAGRKGRGQGLSARRQIAAKAFKKAGGKRARHRTEKGRIKHAAEKALDKEIRTRIPKDRWRAVEDDVRGMMDRAEQRHGTSSRGNTGYAVMMSTLTRKYGLSQAAARRFASRHTLLTDLMFSG